MFKTMRDACSIPQGSDILDHIHALPEVEQKEAFTKIQNIEREAMTEQKAQPGLVTLLEYLDRNDVPKGICTRNFDAPVKHFNETHVPAHIRPFTPIVTRDFRPPKPSPEGVLWIGRQWGVEQNMAVASSDGRKLLPFVMVGDSVDDMEAGYEAGALTVLVRSPGKEDLEQNKWTDVAVDRLDDLVELLNKGLQSTR